MPVQCGALHELPPKKSHTNTSISIMIDKIIVNETDEIGEYNRPKLDIEIVWNTPYLMIVYIRIKYPNCD